MATVIQLDFHFNTGGKRTDDTSETVNVPFGPAGNKSIKALIARHVRRYKGDFEQVWVAALIRRSDGSEIWRTVLARTGASTFGRKE